MLTYTHMLGENFLMEVLEHNLESCVGSTFRRLNVFDKGTRVLCDIWDLKRLSVGCAVHKVIGR